MNQEKEEEEEEKRQDNREMLTTVPWRRRVYRCPMYIVIQGIDNQTIDPDRIIST